MVPAMKVQLEIPVLSVLLGDPDGRRCIWKSGTPRQSLRWFCSDPNVLSLGDCFKCGCLTKLNLGRGRKFIVSVTWPHCPHTYQDLKSDYHIQ